MSNDFDEVFEGLKKRHPVKWVELSKEANKKLTSIYRDVIEEAENRLYKEYKQLLLNRHKSDFTTEGVVTYLKQCGYIKRKVNIKFKSARRKINEEALLKMFEYAEEQAGVKKK